MNTVPVIARRTRRSLVQEAATVGNSAGQTAWRTALVVLVAALALGILGMHAVASHGSPATNDATPGMTSMTGATVDEADQATGSSRVNADKANDAGTQAQVSALGSQADGHGSAQDSGHGSGDAMSMLMLCAVMLAAAALTLLVLLIIGIVRQRLPGAFHPAAVPARALRLVHGTGPPYEWQFSVIRC
jgi:hypothetical protein